MNPSITIHANVRTANGGIQQLTKSLGDLRKALAAVGGDMRKLSAEDRALWDQLNANVARGLKSPIGRSLDRRLRANGIDSSQIFQPGGGGTEAILRSRLHIDPAVDQRIKTNMLEGLGGATLPLPGNAGGRRGAGGMAQGGWSMLKRYAGPLAAIAGVGTVVGGAKHGLDEAGSLLDELGGFQRRVGATAESLKLLEQYSIRAGDGLQVTVREAAQLADRYAEVARSRSAQSATDEARIALELARSYGIEPERAVTPFGAMRAGAAGGDGEEGARRLGLMIAESIGQTGLVSQSAQVLTSFSRFAERYMHQTTRGGDALTQALTDYGGLFTQLSSYGRDSNAPGLIGDGAAELIERLNEVMAQGGAYGEASQVFTMGALQSAGISNPFEARYIQEGGAFERVGGRTMLDLAMKRIEGMYGKFINPDGSRNDSVLDAGSNHFGISMRQMEGLARSGAFTVPGGFGAMGDWMESNGVDMKSMKGSALQELGDLFAGSQRGDISKSLDALRQREDISPESKNRILGMQGSEQVSALAQLLANTGRETNLAVQSQQATVDMKNIIERGMANLLEPLTAIKEVAVSFAQGQSWYRPRSEEQKTVQQNANSWAANLSDEQKQSLQSEYLRLPILQRAKAGSRDQFISQKFAEWQTPSPVTSAMAPIPAASYQQLTQSLQSLQQNVSTIPGALTLTIEGILTDPMGFPFGTFRAQEKEVDVKDVWRGLPTPAGPMRR